MAADPSRIAAAAAAAAASASSLYLSSAPVATPMTHFIPVPHRAGEADDGSATDAGATAGEPPTESGDRSPNATDDDEDTSHYSHNTHATPKRKGKTTLRRRRMEQPGASLAAAAASAASAASSVAAIATQAHAMAHSRLTPGGSGTKRRRPAATSSAESSPLKSEKSALFLDPSLDLLLTPTKRGKTQKLRAAPGSANSAVSTMSAEGDEGDRGGDKGLRLFANKVCEVMQRLQVSTYRHVADELVDSLKGVSSFAPGSGSSLTSRRSVVGSDYQEQNIRRRVYDALNVLESVGAITKDYKDIRWVGLPRQLNDLITAVTLRQQECANRIAAKRAALVELLTQQVSLHTLIERNLEAERQLMQQQMIFDERARMRLQESQRVNAKADGLGQAAPMDSAPTAAASSSSSSAAAASSSSLAAIAASPMTPVKSPPSLASVCSPPRPAPFLSSALASTGSQASPRRTRLPSPYFARHQQAMMASPARTGSAAVVAASADSSSVAAGLSPAASSRPVRSPSLPLPFLLLTTHRSNFVHVQQSDDREEVAIHVSGGAYQLRDVWQLMRDARFHHASPWDLPRILGSRQLCKYYPADAIRQTTDGDDAQAMATLGSPLKPPAQIAADAGRAQGDSRRT